MLNKIEHIILRTYFNEPRIHFAIVCASKSCPSLRREAYEASIVRSQLQEDGENFFNNPLKATISPEKIEVSPIFSWFEEDFTKGGNFIDFVNQFSKVKIEKTAEVNFYEYDWSLND